MPDPAALEMVSGANAKPTLSATSDMPVLDISKRDDEGKFTKSEEGKAAPQGETSGESATPAGDDTTANDTEKHSDESVQKRIDKLTKNWKEEERKRQESDRRAEEAVQRAAELERQRQAPPEVEATDDPPPKRDAYEDPDDYQVALSAWSGRKAVKEYQATQAKAQQQYRVREQFQKMETDWQAGRVKAIETYPDFVEVVDNDQLQIAQHVAFAIKASPQSHDIAYYLGKHPEEAARLSALSPLQSAIEIGVLRATKLSKPEVSRTPTPLKPVGQRSADRGSKEPSMDDYARERMEKLRKRN